MKVIVTGASKGIGAGVARVLGKAGHAVGLLARSAEALAEQADAIRAAGGTCATAVCNLRKADEVFACMDELIDQLGGVDALVNNAGLVTRKSAAEISLDEWHAMVETNLNGLFYATRAVLPVMQQQQSGHIVNVSSVSGKWPLPGGSGYAATKYAVTGFSESLFQEVRDDRIKVTIVFPGSVASESHRQPGSTDAWKVTPEEVGEAVKGLLETGPNNLIHQLEIRPLGRPR